MYKSLRFQENKRKVKTHNYINRQISQQPENCENRNDPDLVQSFLKKWWVESDFKAQGIVTNYFFKFFFNLNSAIAHFIRCSTK